MHAASQPVPPPVVVAVSGDGFAAALDFGAAEALRHGCRLHVVHVVDLGSVTTAHAEHICSRAVGYARELVDQQVPVSSELFHGELLDGLVELGRDARLVVLQRHVPGARRTDPPATSTKLASRASVPVVCVPGDWDDVRHGVVTLGVDDTGSCGPLLREALSAARARDATLRVLHVAPASSAGGREREISSALAEAVEGRNDVAVSITVVESDDPAAELVAAMSTSDLLVIGRHHRRVPRGSQLGPVARIVVREAACPVLLLTPEATSPEVSRPDPQAVSAP